MINRLAGRAHGSTKKGHRETDPPFAVKVFDALFAIMNPITNRPVFLGITNGAPAATQRAIALRVAMYTLAMGAVVAVGGTAILGLFGISIDDLRVAGGLVVLLIALNILNGDHSDSHNGSASKKTEFPLAEAVAFYPLTFPILMEPRTITTLIVYSGQAMSLPDKMALGAVFLALVVLIGVAFSFGAQLGRYPGPTARSIMSRLMSMVLAAIVIDMLVTGLKSLLPGLG